MPRRRRVVQGVESPQDLARKLEVLERELAVQRAAMEKLKGLSTSPKVTPAVARPPAGLKSAVSRRSSSSRRSSAAITSGAHGLVSTWRIPGLPNPIRLIEIFGMASYRKNRDCARVSRLLKRAAELETVHSGNSQIRQHDVRMQFPGLCQRLMPVVRVRDPETAMVR